MKKVSDLQVGTPAGAAEMPLPAEIQEALGELVGSAREGLLALSVGAGLSLVSRLMELEVELLAGPKGSHDRDRVAKRHGYERGSVTLGGRRVTVRRPRCVRLMMSGSSRWPPTSTSLHVIRSPGR